MQDMAVRSNSIPYQYSVRTSRSPETVLDELASRGVVGISVAERGPSYIVLRKLPRYRYTTETAIGIAIGILILVLILTAVTPVFVILIPAALAPAIPFYFQHEPTLALSALTDEDGEATRVTIHGEASPELAAALDAYLGALPAAPSLPDAEAAAEAPDKKSTTA